MARLYEVRLLLPPRSSGLFPFVRPRLNAPSAGETIPIRLFLGGFELTPTFRDVNKKFSTRYYLNLVLIDEENRRYFKCVYYCSTRSRSPTDPLVPPSLAGSKRSPSTGKTRVFRPWATLSNRSPPSPPRNHSSSSPRSPSPNNKRNNNRLRPRFHHRRLWRRTRRMGRCRVDETQTRRCNTRLCSCAVLDGCGRRGPGRMYAPDASRVSERREIARTGGQREQCEVDEGNRKEHWHVEKREHREKMSEGSVVLVSWQGCARRRRTGFRLSDCVQLPSSRSCKRVPCPLEHTLRHSLSIHPSVPALSLSRRGPSSFALLGQLTSSPPCSSRHSPIRNAVHQGPGGDRLLRATGESTESARAHEGSDHSDVVVEQNERLLHEMERLGRRVGRPRVCSRLP